MRSFTPTGRRERRDSPIRVNAPTERDPGSVDACPAGGVVRASRGPGGGGGTLLVRPGGAEAAAAGGGTLPRCPLTWATSIASSFGIFGSSTGARGGAGTYSARLSLDAADGDDDGGVAAAGGCSERRSGGGGGPMLALPSVDEVVAPGSGVPVTALAMVLTLYMPNSTACVRTRGDST